MKNIIYGTACVITLGSAFVAGCVVGGVWVAKQAALIGGAVLYGADPYEVSRRKCDHRPKGEE